MHAALVTVAGANRAFSRRLRPARTGLRRLISQVAHDRVAAVSMFLATTRARSHGFRSAARSARALLRSADHARGALRAGRRYLRAIRRLRGAPPRPVVVGGKRALTLTLAGQRAARLTIPHGAFAPTTQIALTPTRSPNARASADRAFDLDATGKAAVALELTVRDAKLAAKPGATLAWWSADLSAWQPGATSIDRRAATLSP